jgi:hypothetical protein
MSTILVDNLTGKTSAGSITVTSEGGAATQSLQQGLAKCWYCVDVADQILDDSFSVSSLTDNGTGDTSANMTNNFNNAFYSHSGCSENTGTDYTRGPGGFYTYSATSTTTSLYRWISCGGSDAGANGYLRDPLNMTQMHLGDLA